ncbi:MAG: hypothetical protein R3Y53_03120 [Bacillota bacterium]
MSKKQLAKTMSKNNNQKQQPKKQQPKKQQPKNSNQKTATKNIPYRISPIPNP